MPDRVDEYMELEHGLLTHRLRRALAGVPTTGADPEEDRVEEQFERIWDQMTDADRARLRVARETRPRPTPARGGATGKLGVWASSAARGYVIYTSALPEGVELSLPAPTPVAPRRPAAHLARMILDSAEIERFPAGARSVLVESALALLGRTIEEVAALGGLRFVDPATGEELLADHVQPSGVAETPDLRGRAK